MKKIILYLFSAACLFLTACDDFLSKEPTKSSSQKVETLDDLEALLSIPSTNHSTRGSVNFFCTDNAGLPLDVYDVYGGGISRSKIQQYLWDTQIDESSDSYWNSCYSAIWIANLIISSVDNMEGTPERKTRIKAEASSLRAYKYFMLALNYCLHYTSATAQEPGVPLRQGIDFEEGLFRSTLAETYAFIEADLKEALKLDVPFENRRWRASRASVNAFAARYYLYRGNYTEAEKCTDVALGEMDDLIDYTTIGNYLFRVYEIKGSDGQTRKQEVYYPNTYNYTSKQTMDWQEQYQTETESEPGWKINPSEELLDLYRQYPEDLRFKLFMVEGYMNRFSVSEHAYYGYQVLYGSEIYSGPSVAEMYLIRAECKARKNDITGCMSDVETLRKTRFAAADYQALPVPADKKAAVQTVLDERRREAPYALRWMDIRRLLSDDLMSPVTIKRIFYPSVNGEVDDKAQPVEYTLTPESRRYARPIGNEAINLSNGATEQNKY